MFGAATRVVRLTQYMYRNTTARQGLLLLSIGYSKEFSASSGNVEGAGPQSLSDVTRVRARVGRQAGQAPTFVPAGRRQIFLSMEREGVRHIHQQQTAVSCNTIVGSTEDTAATIMNSILRVRDHRTLRQPAAGAIEDKSHVSRP